MASKSVPNFPNDWGLHVFATEDEIVGPANAPATESGDRVADQGVVQSVHDLDDVCEALEEASSGGVRGKVVLRIP